MSDDGRFEELAEVLVAFASCSFRNRFSDLRRSISWCNWMTSATSSSWDNDLIASLMLHKYSECYTTSWAFFWKNCERLPFSIEKHKNTGLKIEETIRVERKVDTQKLCDAIERFYMDYRLIHTECLMPRIDDKYTRTHSFKANGYFDFFIKNNVPVVSQRFHKKRWFKNIYQQVTKKKDLHRLEF